MIVASPNKTDLRETITAAAEIVAAYVSANKMEARALPRFLQQVHDAVVTIKTGDGRLLKSGEPAVPIKKSITPDHIICLEDGKKLKMLKRYLRTHFDLSPEEYRQKWGLPSDYPMVAPSYSKKRSQFAKEIGLGKREEATKANRGRPRKSTAATRKKGRKAKAKTAQPAKMIKQTYKGKRVLASLS